MYCYLKWLRTMKFVQVCIFIVVWATCPSFCSFVSEFLHGILGALEAVGDCHGKLQIQERPVKNAVTRRREAP